MTAYSVLWAHALGVSRKEAPRTVHCMYGGVSLAEPRRKQQRACNCELPSDSSSRATPRVSSQNTELCAEATALRSALVEGQLKVGRAGRGVRVGHVRGCGRLYKLGRQGYRKHLCTPTSPCDSLLKSCVPDW